MAQNSPGKVLFFFRLLLIWTLLIFSKKLNIVLGETAWHGRPLQTPLVCLINSHTMPGCLYCVRGVWRPPVTILNINL